MTVDYSGYTLGANQPLHHARILWDFVAGTVAADGSGGDYATNDYTNQRWTFDASGGDRSWTLTLAANAPIDTVMIAAHNLATIGATVNILTDDDGAGAFTERASITPTDNGTIAAMFTDGSGDPYSVRRLQIVVESGAAAGGGIGIIRAGEALQMTRPLPPGAEPIGLRSVATVRHLESETGNPIGTTVQRRRLEASIGWSGFDADWYRESFQPFAETLPGRPFGLIQNAVSMPESAAWCWVNEAPMPNYAPGRKKMAVGLNIMGFDG